MSSDSHSASILNHHRTFLLQIVWFNPAHPDSFESAPLSDAAADPILSAHDGFVGHGNFFDSHWHTQRSAGTQTLDLGLRLCQRRR